MNEQSDIRAVVARVLLALLIAITTIEGVRRVLSPDLISHSAILAVVGLYSGFELLAMLWPTAGGRIRTGLGLLVLVAAGGTIYLYQLHSTLVFVVTLGSIVTLDYLPIEAGVGRLSGAFRSPFTLSEDDPFGEESHRGSEGQLETVLHRPNEDPPAKERATGDGAVCSDCGASLDQLMACTYCPACGVEIEDGVESGQ
ncbi:hypothetical protein [Haloarchaeobius amylolyticus]|uniref:hypothetical protein n=1 Tax=Haloarchaeobius amylolyticus TaxID=1198296 RepID=UPI002270ADC0|nr:hypothetical protein [Haloarchaeobius amylolyticus]